MTVPPLRYVCQMSAQALNIHLLASDRSTWTLLCYCYIACQRLIMGLYCTVHWWRFQVSCNRWQTEEVLIANVQAWGFTNWTQSLR